MKRSPNSLQAGWITTIVLCWLLPIVIVVTVAGLLLSSSYRSSVQREIDADAQNALSIVEMALSDTIAASKDVSYDGVVRSAYRQYQENGDSAELYRRVSDYLSQTFSRDSKFKAVFISFWDDAMNMEPYVLCSGTTGFELVRTYQTQAQLLREKMLDADTEIRFFLLDGNLYVVRNLLDARFDPYASVVMLCDPQRFFVSIGAIGQISNVLITLDDFAFHMDHQGNLHLETEIPQAENLYYEANVQGHTVAFQAEPAGFNLWAQTPWLRQSVVTIALLVVPLLGIMVYLFFKHITRPMEILAQASQQVAEGRRGYKITEQPPNREFCMLFDRFNDMSRELKNQFDRLYLEQQATQQAKIKALQSQINPHFLNNTLEIINWEARLAENDRVCAMIEALSTMLDAALNRDGRSQIALKEELGYVDAYLYIIRQRLGEGLQVHRNIDEKMLEQKIPRLILQPLVENAVEHDLTERRGGRLLLHVFREGETVVLEVEHDGTMSKADRENIQKLLCEPASGRIRGARVGLRNVNQRLKLLYGEAGQLSIDETTPGTILARVTFPAG